MKKKVVALVMIFMLIGGLCAMAYEMPAMIKVGLCFGSAARNSFTVNCGGKIVVGHEYNHSFYPQFSIDAKSVFVEKGGGAYLKSESYNTLEDAAAKARELRGQGVYAYAGYIDGESCVLVGLYANIDEAESSKSDLDFTNMAFRAIELDTKTVMVTSENFNEVFRSESEIFAFGRSDSAAMSFDGEKYYGYFLADRINNSSIGIVNLVSYDDYVACVVGSEMYSYWPIEALKAQAVIARTYAITTTSYKKYGIDVTDDTRTQAYKGLSRETEATRRAAVETSGKIVLYNQSPAQTFFTASSGGKTADVYSAWGGGAGLDYLRSVDDSYEDENVSVWSVKYSAEQIREKLANINVNIGKITDVVVEDRGEVDERVRKLRFEGSEGVYTVSFETCRTLLGLKSQYYYIYADGKRSASVCSVLSGNGGGEISFAGARVLGGGGLQALVGGAYVMGANESRFINVGEVSEKESFTFEGRGNGHGIGLSQYGAKGMAEAGFTYDQILAHYYPGTTLSD